MSRPQINDDELMHTARIYAECGMNMNKTAMVLFMHRNTVVYRVQLIKQRFGVDIQNFYELAELLQGGRNVNGI